MKIQIDNITIYEITHIKEFHKLKTNHFRICTPSTEVKLGSFVLWGKKLPTGLYSSNDIMEFEYGYMDIITTAKLMDLEKQHMYLEGEQVYYYPHIELFHGDTRVSCKFFKTQEELQSFKEQHKL